MSRQFVRNLITAIKGLLISSRLEGIHKYNLSEADRLQIWELPPARNNSRVHVSIVTTRRGAPKRSGNCYDLWYRIEKS